MTTVDPPEISTTELQIRRTADAEPQRVAVLAEPAGTPGLYITPHADGGRLTGDWGVTHGPSGLAVPIEYRAGTDIFTARRVADELGTLPIDWTADRAALMAEFEVHGPAIRDAIQRGRYPQPAPGAPAEAGPAPYPRTEEQATAEALARVVVESAARRAAASWETMHRRDDVDGRRIDTLNTAALMHGYGLAAALRMFAAVDPVAADHAARDIWSSWQDGGEVHEWLTTWAKEYGIPPAAPGGAPTAADAAEQPSTVD